MDWFRRFMYGRHGVDSFSLGLCVIYFVVYLLVGILSFFAPPLIIGILRVLTTLIVAYAVFRMLSRNSAARQRENEAFLRVWSRIKGGWGGLRNWFDTRQQRAQENAVYAHFKCPSCGRKLRVPRGRGKIVVTCPMCGKEFERKV